MEEIWKNSAIITKRNVDDGQNPISVQLSELKQIIDVHSCIVLNQLPDEFHGVYIDGYTEVYDIEKVSINNYKVDYANGVIYFHPNNIGKILNVDYYGIGYTLLSASRIYTKYDKNGGVLETLEELLDKGELYIEAIETLGGAVEVVNEMRQSIADSASLHENLLEDISTGSEVRDDLEEKTNIANTTINSLVTKTQDGNTTVNQLIDKNAIATEKKQALDSSIQSATDTNTTLSNTNQAGTQINLTLQQTIAEASDDIATINATGNKSLIIGASNFTNGEYTWTHSMNSDDLHVTFEKLETKEPVLADYQRIDKNNILIRNSEENPDLKVILSASYYQGNSVIGSTVEEFLGDSIGTAEDKVRLRGVNGEVQNPVTNSDAVFMTDGTTKLTKKINDMDNDFTELFDEVSDARGDNQFLGDRLDFINASLEDIATLSSSKYGVSGDGSDETSKLVSMLSDIPQNGAKLVFDKRRKVTINGTSLLSINGKQNVVIEGLNVTGNSSSLFKISGGSNHITFRDCYFNSVIQVVLLLDCENITIENCIFDNTGYGIIQQNGYVSNNVKILNCTAKNMKMDFIECNCEINAPSKNWSIIGNHYLGSDIFPTVGTEDRFFGATAVNNIIISNNIVENVSGDSAVHLEKTGGNVVISNNVFKNCLGTGYIYILHADKDTIIQGNFFETIDVNNLTPFLYYTSSTDDKDTEIIFSDNVCKTHSSHNNLLVIGTSSAKKIISNNIFSGFNTFMTGVAVFNLYNFTFNNNILNGSNGIIFKNQTSGDIKDWNIIGNTFNITNNALDIDCNTSANAFPKRILIASNKFNSNVSIKNSRDVVIYGSIFTTSHTLTFGSNDFYSQNMIAYGNIIEGVGLNITDNYVLANKKQITSLNLQSGFVNGSICQTRRSGEVVTLDFYVTGTFTSGASTLIGNITDVNARPSSSILGRSIVGGDGDISGNVTINTDGNINVKFSTASTFAVCSITYIK